MPAARNAVRRRLARAGVAVALLAAAAAAAVAILWATLPDPAPLARENPRTTALIEQRRAEARARRRPFHPRQAWVPLERVAPVLVNAVIASEDANFFGHEGIDWEATYDAAEADLRARRFARGASTLTQQLAKNLWLGTERSLVRKAKEAVLAAKLERTLPKRRILALYLNVVELGEGTFGMEAGARARFGTSAAAVTPAQAVVLASLLPAPRRVDLARPSTWLKNRARRLLDRLQETGRLPADAHRRASAELERILAGPAPADDRDEAPDEEDAPPPAAAAPAPAAPAPAAPREPQPEPEPEPEPAPEARTGAAPPAAAAPAEAPAPVAAPDSR
jgi:monofunctional biosynthetic peptidoglycan transglycosylase